MVSGAVAGRLKVDYPRVQAGSVSSDDLPAAENERVSPSISARFCVTGSIAGVMAGRLAAASTSRVSIGVAASEWRIAARGYGDWEGDTMHMAVTQDNR